MRPRRLPECPSIPRRIQLPAWATLNTGLQVMAAVFGLSGQYLVNQQNPTGFVLWLGANATLMWLQLRMRLFVLVFLSAAYFGLCVQGLLNWSK